MLEPLKQFICDTCGEIIEKPEDGWLEWVYDENSGKYIDFRIVHAKNASPKKSYCREGCYQHGNRDGRLDNHLKHIIDPDTLMSFLLSFIDLGEYHDPECEYCARVDFREYAELVRRLTIPHYEEARLYWEDAKSGGYFDGANEIVVYSVRFLKDLINNYSDNRI